MKSALLGVCGALLFGVGATSTAPPLVPPPADVAVRYVSPVTPMHVVRSFDPPTEPFGPGHLGVDLATSTGSAVRAAGAGVVAFAASVAGRGLVVVQHADGVRTEYEPVQPTVHRGDEVQRGQVIGQVHGTHGDCEPGACLHWGARRGDEYLDPLLLLQPLGPVRLLPWDA
jgi:murein DD-endopeptidase MepM/ murein hydrolase activator NlpD